LVEETYECENCGKKIVMSNGKTPTCCGKTITDFYSK